MGRPYSKAQGGAAIVVAAADTPGVLKSRADLVCTGTSTTGGDESTINAALGRADAVVLCPGTFWVSGSILLGTGQSLLGSGPNSVIKVRNGHNADVDVIVNSDTAEGNDYIAVRDLVVDGNGGNQSRSIDMNGVNFSNCKNGIIQAIVARDFSTGDYSEGIRLTTCGYFRVLDNRCHENSYASIYLRSCNNVLVQGNICTGYGNDGIDVTRPVGLPKTKECAVIGNICYGHKIDGIWLNDAEDCIVQGNICVGNGLRGIGLSRANSRNLIIGNVCADNSQSAHLEYDNIREGDNSSGFSCTIQGNRCYSRTVSTSLSGAHSAGATEITVSDTTGFIIGLGITIDADGSAGKRETHRIANIVGNVVTLRDGLTNDQADGEDVAFPRTHAGIGLGPFSTAAIVCDNDVRDGGNVNISVGGANAIIRNNRGYNPVGISPITVGASPFTYTAGASPETVYVSGGTVTSITKGGNNFGLTSGCFNLEPYESIIVTYTVAPTMFKDVH